MLVSNSSADADVDVVDDHHELQKTEEVFFSFFSSSPLLRFKVIMSRMLSGKMCIQAANLMPKVRMK